MNEKESIQEEPENVESSTTEDSAEAKSPSNEENSSEETVSEEPTMEQLLENEKNKYLRLYAEFENFRRRNAKERIELIGTASSDVIKEILPIVDDFERAIESNKKVDDINTVKEGFELLYNKLFKTLSGKGLQTIEVKGESFDAEVHEAVAQIPAPKTKDKGIILDVVEKGYKLNDKVIRHPKVVVGS